MENQHRKISGYRELTQVEIDLMNKTKALGEQLGLLIQELHSTTGIDGKWVGIAETHLQQGIMAAVRSVAKPTTF